MTTHSRPGSGVPQDDVQFLRGLLARAQRRVDPHAFHCVHWGAIVLVWYPLVTWFQSRGNGIAMGIVAGHAASLTHRTMEALTRIDGLRVYGVPPGGERSVGLSRRENEVR